jgi:hypothetical protein
MFRHRLMQDRVPAAQPALPAAKHRFAALPRAHVFIRRLQVAVIDTVPHQANGPVRPRTAGLVPCHHGPSTASGSDTWFLIRSGQLMCHKNRTT